MSAGERKLLGWARRANRLRAVPVDDEALAGISALGTQAAKRRMAAGVDPDGRSFKPLSKVWVQRKGHAQFWVGRNSKGHRAGEAKRRTVGAAVQRGVTTAIRWIINTPYSGAVHDGAVIHRTSTTHSVEARRKMIKKGAARATAYSKRLAAINGLRGKGSYAKARAIRADELRLARNARNRGEASLLPQYRRQRSDAFDLRSMVSGLLKRGGRSYTVTIPARPVLGLSRKDKIGVGRILAKAAQRRMESDLG